VILPDAPAVPEDSSSQPEAPVLPPVPPADEEDPEPLPEIPPAEPEPEPDVPDQPDQPDQPDPKPAGSRDEKQPERERFSKEYPFRRVRMNPEPGIRAPAAGELIWPKETTPMQRMLKGD
jgi:hypothetical protein